MNVVVAIGSAPWEAKFVSALAHPMCEIRIVRRCVDGIDVRAVVAVHEVNAVLVSDDTLRVDANLVAELKSSGIRVVALSSDSTYWNSLGVIDCLIIDPNQISQSINALADLLSDGTIEDVPEPDSFPLLACASFGGGVGRSLIARELSYVLAHHGHTTVCVEADTFGPTLIQDLCLPTDTFNLLDAYRLLKVSESDLAMESFLERFSIVAPNLAILPGLARASQWIELRPDFMVRTYQQLQQCFDFTVVDVGPVLEDEFDVSAESNYPRRLATTLTAIQQASDIILCTTAETASVTRLIKNFLELNELFSHADVHVVLNKIRDHKLGVELEKSIQRYTGISSVFSIDECHQIIEKATSNNQFISNMTKQSSFSQGISSLGSVVMNRKALYPAEQKLHQVLQVPNVA